jgi:iron complex transport system substrate-binding protein
MKIKLVKITVLLTAALFVITGCIQSDKVVASPDVSIVDQMDRQVSISSVPIRIVSLAPGNTEIAYALGLGDYMVGVTDNCNYPQEALAVAKVGGFSKPNIEAILALEPDLVIAGNKHVEQVKKLDEMGIPALILVPESMEEVFKAMELVGKATGKATEAENIVAGMKERIQAVQTKVEKIPKGERVRVYYEVASDPLMSIGSTSIIHEVIDIAGGNNIFSDVTDRYPKISQEVLIERDPQIILFPKSHGSITLDAKTIAARPLWNTVTAVKENKMFEVSADTVSRAGPRLVEAVERLTEIFYQL